MKSRLAPSLILGLITGIAGLGASLAPFGLFLEVYERGREYIRENPREAARLLSGELKLPPGPLERVLARFDFDPRLSDDDIAELKSSEEFMSAARIIQRRVDIATFVSPVPPGPSGGVE